MDYANRHQQGISHITIPITRNIHRALHPAAQGCTALFNPRWVCNYAYSTV